MSGSTSSNKKSTYSRFTSSGRKAKSANTENQTEKHGIEFFSGSKVPKAKSTTRTVSNLRPIHTPYPKKYPTLDVGKDVINIVASVLSLEVESNQWEIRDRVGDLVLVNYSDSADMSHHGFLCGVIVDLKKKIPVCASHGFVPTAVRDDINTTSDQHAYTISTIEDNRYLLPVSDTIIRPSVNGTILRVFKHNGEVHVSNHTHIDVGERKWANSMPFLDMLHKVLPPTKLKSLFPSNVDNSPYCYVFAVASKETVVSNRFVFPSDDSVLVSLISVFQLWIPEDATYPEKYTNPKYDSKLKELKMLDIFHRPILDNKNDIWETWTAKKEIFDAPHFADVVAYTSDANEALKKQLLYVPPILSQDDAVEFLKYGFYANDPNVRKMVFTDPKTTPGEAIIMITRDNRLTTNVLRVHSIASKWRTDIRQGDPNILRRLMTLSMLLHTNLEVPSELQAYHDLIPAFDPNLSSNDMYNAKYGYTKNKPLSGVLLNLPTVDSDPKMSKDDMLKQICIAYAFSLPPSMQNSETFMLYYTFVGIQYKVADFLYDAYTHGTETSYRGKILTNGAVDLKVSGNNDNMLDNFRKSVNTEVGCSLYRLYQEANRYFNKDC